VSPDIVRTGAGLRVRLSVALPLTGFVLRAAGILRRKDKQTEDTNCGFKQGLAMEAISPPAWNRAARFGGPPN